MSFGNHYEGFVKVFYWNGNNWIQKGNNISDGNIFSQFGYDHELNYDGTYIVVGAPHYQYISNSFTYKGLVQVYKWDGTNWTQKFNTIYGDANNDFLAEVVSISNDGNTIAVDSRNNINPSAGEQVKIYSTTVSVQEFEINKNISIYPNPTSGILTIDFDENDQYSIEITDLTGKLINTYNSNTQQKSIDLSNYKKGVYIISILIDKEKYSKKLIIE